MDVGAAIRSGHVGGTCRGARRSALEDVADLAQAYDAYYAGLSEQFAARLAQITSPDADPADDGAETVNRVGGLVRIAFYQRIGLDDLLSPR